MKNQEQDTAQWHQDRLGKITASRVHDVVARTKAGKPTSKYNDYLYELVAERLTGEPIDVYVNRDMQYGKDNEPRARASYEMLTGRQVIDEGFMPHPTIKNAGASPDGLIGLDGQIEIKIPRSNTFVKYIMNGAGEIEEQYFHQMQWQMACSGRLWCDYQVYNPRVKDVYAQSWIYRVKRDDELIKKMELEVIKFDLAVTKAVETVLQRTKESIAA